ncbi:MAG: bifunctional DNA-formamidopyrimidine glycosylase/DNA-(apurinic or apyrimidinic site) lyase [Candidatus Krumholzibacteriota bacterium]|nr:bifunctional DNA-formamidopyrimidine glycosylase/DNA-(apurinic or apyrimidinic site) lyase [Candidatus Krumholzibacteriota bacterium]
MPELPEVETVVRQLRRKIVHRRVVSGRILHKNVVEGISSRKFLSSIKGKMIQAVTRRGKFIIFTLDNGRDWISHLGMTGKYVVCGDHGGASKHRRAYFSLSGGCELIFVDMRVFGKMLLVDSGTGYLAHLGVEPLSDDLDARYLRAALARRRIPIKTVLMDQKMVAGIGNIYASEILFDARLSPRKQAHRLTRKETVRLTESIKRILKQAVELNGTTISDFRGVDDKSGRFQEMLKVYGRRGESCYACGHPIRRIVQAQRSTFYCTHCQRAG